MSRWLQSVNNLLEKLDDQAEETAYSVIEEGVNAAPALAKRVLQRGGFRANSSEDEDDEDDEEYYDEDASEDEGFEQNEDDLSDVKGEDDRSIEEEEGSSELDEEEVLFSDGQDLSLLTNDVSFSEEEAKMELSPEIDQNLHEQDFDAVVVEAKDSSPQTSTAHSGVDFSSDEYVFNQHSTGEDTELTDDKFFGTAASFEEHGLELDTKTTENEIKAVQTNSHRVDSPPLQITQVDSKTRQFSGKSPSPPVPSRSNKNISGSASVNANLKRDIKQAQLEIQRLQKLNATLQSKLNAASAEVQAQQDELMQAAQLLEQERSRANEDREDLLDEQDEEMEKMKEQYEKKLKAQKETYERDINEYKSRLEQEQQMLTTEQGNLTKELEEALQRERDVLQKLNDVQSEKLETYSRVSKLETQIDALQKQVQSLSAAAAVSVENQRIAEERLDRATIAHKQQLAQRQTREAELESTIAELSAALTKAQQEKPDVVPVGEQTGEMSYKEKYDAVKEELESTRVQLKLSTQQFEALQREMHDLSLERASEAAAAQESQQESDRRITALNAHIGRIEKSLRGYRSDVGESAAPSSGTDSDHLLQTVTRELEESKKQVQSLTDQLFRQQGLTESSKSEILALKGRLQAALTRAEVAENSAAASIGMTDSKMHEVESGGVLYSSNTRRRVKGGRTRFGHLSSRSIRTALGIRAANGTMMQTLVLTIDDIDRWMLETSDIMRHEPYARLGFALYLTILHVWCFALVFFHTVESEHGDLGTLMKNKGASRG